ncbi:MAG: glycoside hydrolase family 3 protein [Firmicutes bacterium]|jgi:beta-N-acetylhexosaminidase|nr:glycoside hydrolase family 3 protein [Bacillota bacterium]MDH7494676.1 glycoside hydrolase family 3 protein [Bacillota bacterium]
MTQRVESLIGQLFITGLPGPVVDPAFEAHYSRCPSGGFILFGRNVRDSAQVRGLTGALADLASRRYQDCGPPMIAIDQEGGSLSPLRRLVSSLPGNMGLAATGDPEAARLAGYVTGRDLLSLGINTNLAPVLDLAREPLNPAVGTRSFGDDPKKVAELGAAYADGLLRSGVRFVAKHFPGHGTVSEDSHLSLPECRMSKDVLLAQDAVPFIEVASIPKAALMVAHVRIMDIDPRLPASLSHRLVTGLLRKHLGFDGVVLTDCLEMGGVREVSSVPEAAVMAIEAGCDMVLISHTPELQEAAFEAMRDAVLSGRLDIERVERSVARIHDWKQGLAATVGAPTAPLATLLPRDARSRFLDGLGERVVTFVDGDVPGSWTFEPTPVVLVTPSMDRITLAEDSVDASLLLQALESVGITCERVHCSMDPDPREIEEVVARVMGSWRAMARGARHAKTPESHTAAATGEAIRPRVAFVVRNGGKAPGQAALARALEAIASLLLVGIRDPREVRMLQAVLSRRAPAVFTYSTENIVLNALARVMAGKASPKGVVPVKM